MKKTLYAIAFIILFFPQLVSQTWSWSSSVLAKGDIQLCKDEFQNIYTYTVNDTVLKKYTASGSLLWQINFLSNLKIKSVACSPDSTVYLLGEFTGSVNVGSAGIVSKGQTDICIAKFSPGGNLIWLKGAGSKSVETAGDICMNGTDFIITGSAADTMYIGSQVFAKTRTPDIFIAKYLSSGIISAVKFATNVMVTNWNSVSLGYEVTTDHAGDIVVLAGLDGQIQIDTFNIVQGSAYGTPVRVLLKFSQSLSLLWHLGLGSGSKESSSDILVNSQNKIFYLHHVGSQYNPSSSRIRWVPPSGGSTIPFYMYGYGGLSAIALDSCDNLYFTGYHLRSQHSLFPPVHSLFNGQLSPGGTLNWMRKDSSIKQRWGTDIAVLGINKCLIAGYFHDTITLAGIHIGNYVYPYTPQIATKYGYFHAYLQTTVGTPVNTTSQNNQVVCANKKTILSASSGGLISWYTSMGATSAISTGMTFTTPVLSSGVHTWYVEASTCTMTTNRIPVTVTVNPTPTITVNNGAICKNQSYTIIPMGAVNYTFTNGGPVVTPTITSNYKVIGENALGCRDSAICWVSLQPLPQVSINSSINFLCIGQSAVLTGTGAPTYSWSNGAAGNTIIVTPSVNTIYTVTGSAGAGCSSTAAITQFVTECLSIDNNIISSLVHVYPNPAQDRITIETAVFCHLRIFNSLSEVMLIKELSDGKNMLELKNFKSGIYFIELVTGNSTQLQKLIIQ